MDQAIIDKFIRGNASPEEVRKVLKWYYSDEAEYQMAEKIERLWHKEENSLSSQTFNKAEILANIKARVNIEMQQNQIQMETGRAKKVNRPNILKIAASIILIFTIGWLIYNWTNFSQQQQHNFQVNQVQMLNKSTAKGQKFTFFLEDGTKVKLNAESSLEFPVTFSDSNRIVYLNGEGFFDIKHDPQRPFSVITRNISTTALGTSFNINAYPEDEHILVSLATGKVKVNQLYETGIGNRQNVLTLEPGTQAVYSIEQQNMHKQAFNLHKELAWKDGILFFEDASWLDIVNQLERWYGVELLAENKPANDKLYTGSFYDESLDNVLESLSFSKNFNYHIKSQKVYVEFN